MLSREHADAAGQSGCSADRLLEIIAETTGVDRLDISLDAPLAAVLDSLTLAAVVVRAEAAFGVALSSQETLELLAARDVRDFCRLAARIVERSRKSS